MAFIAASLVVTRVVRWLRASTPRARRVADFAGCRNGNGAVCPVVCGDPKHQAQLGSGGFAAKELLHTVI